VEALYDQRKHLPAQDEGLEMAKLRREMNRRMLGNGYCARPVELDCHFADSRLYDGLPVADPREVGITF
jgi:hypothetical protein